MTHALALDKPSVSANDLHWRTTPTTWHRSDVMGGAEVKPSSSYTEFSNVKKNIPQQSSRKKARPAAKVNVKNSTTKEIAFV
jgi:hypothetical protein